MIKLSLIINTEPSGTFSASMVSDESVNPSLEELDIFTDTRFQPLVDQQLQRIRDRLKHSTPQSPPD